MPIAQGIEVTNLLADGVLNYVKSNFYEPGSELRSFVDTMLDTGSVNEIPVYYIRASIRTADWPAQGSESLAGFTMPPSWPSRGTIVISMPDRLRSTLAHEIGHALGVLTHALPGQQVRHRLMTDRGTVYVGDFHDSKRFSPEEENAIKSTDKFYVPIP